MAPLGTYAGAVASAGALLGPDAVPMISYAAAAAASAPMTIGPGSEGCSAGVWGPAGSRHGGGGAEWAWEAVGGPGPMDSDPFRADWKHWGGTPAS